MRRVVPWHAIGDTLVGWLKRIPSSTEGVVHNEEVQSERNEERNRRTITEYAVETGRTPEAYVAELLSAHEGEMRQQEIIAETGWSRSSVSRLLRGMEADDTVVRVRLGSENVVYLPEAVPEMVHRLESPPVART